MQEANRASAPIGVLGATGFAGRHLCRALAMERIPYVSITRREAPDLGVNRVVRDFRDTAELRSSLEGIDTIVHLADEAGRFAAADKPPIAASLVRALDGRSVKLVYASSIYARLDEEGIPSEYGQRKRLQEAILSSCTRSVGLRLPPVYGYGCGGSFALLVNACARGIPLPLGTAIQPRSYVSQGNLTDLILSIVGASSTAWSKMSGQLFEPEDLARISTRDLAAALYRHFGKPVLLVPVPRRLLEIGLKPLGRGALVAGAFDKLEARGNADLASILGWRPRDGLPESLNRNLATGEGKDDVPAV